MVGYSITVTLSEVPRTSIGNINTAHPKTQYITRWSKGLTTLLPQTSKFHDLVIGIPICKRAGILRSRK